MEKQNRQEKIPYQDFIVCPHCEANGKNGFLWSVCGLPPLISRSDGESYHLFLNDRPIRYPIERGQNKGKILISFSYTHDRGRDEDTTTGVIFRLGEQRNLLNLQIKDVTDALSSELSCSCRLESLYDLTGDPCSAPPWSAKVLRLWNRPLVVATAKKPSTLPTCTYVRRNLSPAPTIVM
jgi:hypothetical protein